MKSLIIMMLTGIACLAQGQDLNSEVPNHLKGMRSFYEGQFQRINNTYLQELSEIRQVYLDSNQQEKAKAVDAEISQLKLRIPPPILSEKQRPSNQEELMEFLDGTTWSIRYGSTSGEERYQMTFSKNGTLKLGGGRVSTLEALGPKTIRLWEYDTAIISDRFSYFTAADCHRKIYYGVLVPTVTNPHTVQNNDTQWKWGSGGELVMKADGTAMHSIWEKPGHWERLEDGRISLFSGQNAPFRIAFLDDGTGIVTAEDGGNTTISPITSATKI